MVVKSQTQFKGPANKQMYPTPRTRRFLRLNLALRHHLSRKISDVELDAFCMDFFPKVYNEFGTTMGKDQKINFLLDHCRRDPALIERLVQLLHQEFPAFSI